MGIELDSEKIDLFDVQIGYPIENNPYREKGISSVIVSYLSNITEDELANIVQNKVSIEGCDIIEIMIESVPDVLKAIKSGKINVYPALEATLLKLEKHLKEGN